jgi:hypothetical protein
MGRQMHCGWIQSVVVVVVVVVVLLLLLSLLSIPNCRCGRLESAETRIQASGRLHCNGKTHAMGRVIQWESYCNRETTAMGRQMHCGWIHMQWGDYYKRWGRQELVETRIQTDKNRGKQRVVTAPWVSRVECSRRTRFLVHVYCSIGEWRAQSYSDHPFIRREFIRK